MLRIKQVRADRVREKTWNDQGKQERPPAKKIRQRDSKACMQNERDQAVEMFPGFAEKRPEAHTENEHGHIPEQNGQRMADEQIRQLRSLGRLQIMLLGHDRKRADMGALDLRIVIVMMVMRAPPDTAGAQRKNSKKAHEDLSEFRFRQNGVMLLVMIDNKQP